MSSYYQYGPYNPQALNDRGAGHWEFTSDWPRTYSYIPSYDNLQGVHPPAPVYQSGQAQQPTMYYYTQNTGTTQPTAYYANGYYYSVPQSSAQAPPSYYCQPVTNPTPTSWTPVSNYSWYNAANAAAAAAAAATAASAPTAWFGATKAEVDAQNAMIAYNTGSTMPTQLAPYKPSAGQQFWCKELDQSWTLRTYNDIIMGELNPGYWQRGSSGFPFFIRQSPT